MIVSMNSMNSGKTSCYLLWVRRENRCALRLKTFFHRIEDMILTDTMKHSITEIEGKLKLVLGSELQKEYVAKKNEEIRRRQNVFTKRSCGSLAMTEASNEIYLSPAAKRKAFSDGEEIAKRCIQIFARSLSDKIIERKADDIALSKQTATRHTEELPNDVPQQLRDHVKNCTFFTLALDESTDICDVAKLSIFIRGIDDNFSVFEELHGKTRGSDIFDKVKSCLEN